MPRRYYDDLFSFVTIAREGSFTRAAAQLGVSQSALSQSMKALEQRMGLRLLARNTRSIATTDVGDRLLAMLGPRFADIEAEVAELQSQQQRPAGTIRINTFDFVAEYILWPRLEAVIEQFPEITVEVCTDYALTDIVASRFDIGVRLGPAVEQDMIAVALQPEQRMVIVGAPTYFADNPAPTTPDDLARHQAANLRLPTRGAIYAWELARGDEEIDVRVPGRLVFDTLYQIRRAVRRGYGLGFLPIEMVASDIETGVLQTTLDDWAPSWPGHYLYYPSRRQSSRALHTVVDGLRYRAARDDAS
ncbi:LysR family transcriptional regulator [Salinisphaera sp. Q1T1-3]|uniref:LysR family transcriptional regulator n=1 Tax=Salinisphaera sp. Q1T1-3 TaxID=2321229 RepID=UPI000E740233|nr:LysR family transcriptional regulator [Salinisphaera sp. Q1T1-3]RJS93704.1 LysR family transcriptional regulator [Salinisphaera sp. Q1T1-3]